MKGLLTNKKTTKHRNTPVKMQCKQTPQLPTTTKQSPKTQRKQKHPTHNEKVEQNEFAENEAETPRSVQKTQRSGKSPFSKAAEKSYLQDYASTPKALISSIKTEFPLMEGKWVWNDDLYRRHSFLEYDHKKIFQRKALRHNFIAKINIGLHKNSEQRQRPVRDHVVRLVNLSRQSFKAIALIVPGIEENQKWYVKLAGDPDIVTLRLTTPVTFGERHSIPIHLIIRGYVKQTCANYTIQNTPEGMFRLQPYVPQPYKQRFHSSHEIAQEIPDLDIVQTVTDLTKQRQKGEIYHADLPVSTQQKFSADFNPTTGQNFYELRAMHVFERTPKKLKRIPTHTLHKWRNKHSKRWKVGNRNQMRCIHCGSTKHTREQCFQVIQPKRLVPVKSKKAKALISWFNKQKLPKTEQIRGPENGLGKRILAYLNEVQRRANNIKLSAHDQLGNITNVFPREFSLLPRCLHRYMAFGFPKHLCMKLITGFKPVFIKEPPAVEGYNPIDPAIKQEIIAADLEHEKAGRITEVDKSFLRYVAPRFALQQDKRSYDRKGKMSIVKKIRLIWNGAALTPWCPHYSFYLTSPKKLEKFTGFMISIDLTKAYFQLPVHYNTRAYFGFKGLNNKYYCYNSMPFGLSTAPYLFDLFSKTIARIITTITGFMCEVYLDDFLIQISPTLETPKDELFARVRAILRFFTMLGLQINKKSDIFPSSELKWLGSLISATHTRVFPTIEKVEKLVNIVQQIDNKPSATLAEYQSMRGIFNDIRSPHCGFLAKPVDTLIAEALSDLPAEATCLDYTKAASIAIPHTGLLTQLKKLWYKDILDSLKLNRGTPLDQHFVMVSDASEAVGGCYAYTKRLKWENINTLPTTQNTTRFTFPITAEVQATSSDMGQASSFIRELDVLVTTAKIFASKWQPTDRLVFMLDNLGLVYSLNNKRFRTAQMADYATQFWDLVREYDYICIWHPRDCPQASLADALSKSPDLKLKISNIKLTESLGLKYKSWNEIITEGSIPMDTISIVHPYTPKRTLRYLLECNNLQNVALLTLGSKTKDNILHQKGFIRKATLTSTKVISNIKQTFPQSKLTSLFVYEARRR